ncbi:MAG: class I SAM-dependent methyltransferase [Deltaproteobacteria bacterium]|nr:class I SAM-dependent methyltransferase [Deltaproteobacteria bacterium]
MPAPYRRRSSPSPRPRAKHPRVDRHRLYEDAVQSADAELDVVERVLRRAGRPARALREDFCGTALLAATWVGRGPRRVAAAVDLDAGVLAWARRHRLPALGAAAGRLALRQADVRRGPRGPFDAILALNFSWQVFTTRAALRGYLASARRALRPGGALVLDAFGGWEALRPLREKRPLGGGAFYEWEQVSFDPITHRLRCAIHFRLPGGRRLDRAFAYDWRLWSLPEITELMAEAGLTAVEVLWDPTPEGAEPAYRPRRSAESQAGWLAYVVGRRPRG